MARPKRAGAGDHQHRDRGRERGAQLGTRDVRTREQQPDGKGEDGDGQDHGDEDGADPVGEAGDRRLSGLCLGHEAAHLGQRGFRSDAGGADQQPAGGVDGGARDGAAGAHFNGHRFAGHQGGVDGGGAVDDDAVGGDLLARADHDDVVHGELIGRDLHFGAVGQDRGVLGAQVQQGLEGVAGLRLGVGFEEAAQQQEGGDHGGDLEVQAAGPPPIPSMPGCSVSRGSARSCQAEKT